MLALSRWKIVLVLGSLLFGLIFTLPNLAPPAVLSALPAWAPHQKLSLGLDLQGGSYLLLEVDTAALNKERLTNLTEDVRTRLRADEIAFTDLVLTGATISVHITEPSQTNAAFRMLSNSLGEQLRIG